jgi:UDP-N-acetylmuramoyl-tripeptide--D-alanyl-D-alanine ligase
MFDVRKIGVTGSTGKTTTKDMLFRICREKFKTVKSEGNLNNHIGLPLSAFSIERDTEVAIFEMGMDKVGEIDFLSEIVRPQIGVITNVGVSHIDNFANREGILKAKLEITNYFSGEDALVVYSDNDMLSEEKIGGKYSLVRVGSGGRDDFVISGIEERGDKGSGFFLEHGADMEKFSLPMPGRHNVTNAALAAAAASCLGVPMSAAAKALSKPVLSDRRLRIKGKDGMKIIDDTYNASPDSMVAALDILASVHGVRRIAILGDMLELGAGSPGYHRQIGAYAADKRTDILIAVGDRAGDIAEGAKRNMPGARIFHYASKKAAMPRITELLTPGDVVLVKGSRAMAMEEIVKRILE